MTEDSAISPFGSPSARPDTLRTRVGGATVGGATLARSPKQSQIGLESAAIRRMSVNQ
jgi:hypothetical protein